MKKLLAVLVILITFGISASSYGASLVYKISISVKGVDYDNRFAKVVSGKRFFVF